MAKILIKVEKEDIKTTKLGDNIMIKCEDGIDLVFTPEAVDEFITDYNIIKNKK